MGQPGLELRAHLIHSSQITFRLPRVYLQKAPSQALRFPGLLGMWGDVEGWRGWPGMTEMAEVSGYISVTIDPQFESGENPTPPGHGWSP